jgi:broad specificity phosphatase PhoE
VSARRVIAGRLDVALSKRGLEQARAAGARLAKAPLTAVYTSTSRRALDTAWAIAGPHGLTPVPDPDLREIDFGALEGLTFDAVTERHPEIAAAWLSRPHEIEFPGGECLEALRRRVGRAFHEILGRHPSTAVALACHAGPIRELVGAALGLAPERALQLACEHGSVTTLDFGRAPYCAAAAGDKPPPYGEDK